MESESICLGDFFRKNKEPVKWYGILKVLNHKGRYCLVRCDCGTIKYVRIDHLKSGATISCGCVGRHNSSVAKIKHGMSNTRVFKIWMGILDRCKNDRSGNYGQRGISVCGRWLKFENFYEDMGDPPTSRHSIDRKNVNGDYEPDNCRWATAKMQARNTRRNTILEFKGERKILADWSEVTGIKSSTICVRIYKLGWSIDKALSTPVEHKPIRPWLNMGLSRSTYYRRLEFEKVTL